MEYFALCLGVGLFCVGLFWWLLSVDPDRVVIVCECVAGAGGCVLAVVVCGQFVMGWMCGECVLLLAVGKEPRGQVIWYR